MKIEKLKSKIKNKIFLILIICLVIVSCILFLLFTHRDSNTESFANAYSVYAEAAEKHRQAAYLPAAETNTTRQYLDYTLSGVLTEEISQSQRLDMSKDGMKWAKESEKQIDDIGSKADMVNSAITAMENGAALIKNKNLKEKAGEIIEMAKDESGVIADIRGISYRTDYSVEEIFKRILSNGGLLTESHILYLNDQISEAEQQFDKRSALYVNLVNLNNQIEKKYADFENSI